jgi:hypothetical protein
MKVISLLQPWATLVVMGAKKIETRSWNTKYRGEILIHASAGKKKECRDLCTDLSLPFRKHIEDFDKLSFGAIIGKVNLEWTAKTEILKERLCEKGNILIEHMMHSGEQELAFGDYSPGRYGWYVDNPVQFSEPIPCKGSLSIWNFEDVFQQIPAL